MNSEQARLGVCYYPEHWPEAMWKDDARRMADLGISVVRIGEFAWSRLEPEPGQLDLEWLDRAIEILGSQGLKVVLGTPTATPPKWLVDQMPDMLAVDADGRVRGFGSRRHYCFSHAGYRHDCARIVEVLARRYGNNPHVIAWQTDNEYGCHDTTLSYSPSALAGFREWLQQKYQSPQALNRAWGNVFWSMEYRGFDEVELPNLAVTEVNPAHLMDFRRYASDQVVSFNLLQVGLIRKHAPGHDVLHNYMGRILDFDHFAVGSDLDIATWDSYPLGFLEDRSDRDEDWKRRFARAGDPDFQAFHHDLYRAVGRGRWWVMEQQPGPVNWAPHNPAPAPGMVATWSMEAIAHGAEAVCYFRWRQAPFAQEQMHAGLLLPNGDEAGGFREAGRFAHDLKVLGHLPSTGPADVAIIFDYASAWAWAIQPQGAEFCYFALVFDFYCGLRRAGLNVDFVNAEHVAEDEALSGYKLVIVPGLFAWSAGFLENLSASAAQVLVGPRSGSKTKDFSIPEELPPSMGSLLPGLTVAHVESIRPDCPVTVNGGAAFKYWFEHVSPAGNSVELETEGGEPAVTRNGTISYLSGWPDELLMDQLVSDLCARVGILTVALRDGLRLTRRGDLVFATNYGDQVEALDDLLEPLANGATVTFLIGDKSVPAHGYAVFRIGSS